MNMKENRTQEFGKSTFLVLGGAGFIGSHFVRLLSLRHPEIKVINYDALTYSGNPRNLDDLAPDKRYVFVKGDIADPDGMRAVFLEYKPDYVINFAAETHVDKSIHGDSSLFIKTNITGTFCVLEEVRRAPWVKKFVQVSTDEVYGSLELGDMDKFTERSPLSPNSPYAASKAAGDLLCRSYAKTFNIPVVVTRCGNNYGPNQYPEKLIPFFITRMMAGKKLPLYGDGENIRDWIFVGDHCSALELCLEKGSVGEIYNIGANNELTNKEIAGIIIKYFRKDESRIEYVADRPGHDRRYAINNDKIMKELGWRPGVPFDQGIIRTIKWYEDNVLWLDDLQEKAKVFNNHLL